MQNVTKKDSFLFGYKISRQNPIWYYIFFCVVTSGYVLARVSTLFITEFVDGRRSPETAERQDDVTRDDVISVLDSPLFWSRFRHGKDPGFVCRNVVAMETVATLVKVTLPSYLANLTIPKSVDEFASLSGSEWTHLIGFMLTIGIICYALIRLFHPSVDKGPKGKGHPINPSIKKDCPKVVDVVDVEDLDKEKVSYCRCWKSKKFPLCDGSHNAHNEETGDNVGPVVIRKKVN